MYFYEVEKELLFAKIQQLAVVSFSLISQLGNVVNLNVMQNGEQLYMLHFICIWDKRFVTYVYFRFRFVHILIPADRFWSQLGVEILRKNVLKKNFSNTTCPEYFELVWNHPQVIYRLKFVKIMIPGVRVGPQLVAGVQC